MIGARGGQPGRVRRAVLRRRSGPRRQGARLLTTDGLRLGRPLGTGRTADVYDLGDGRVLRRYRIDGDTASEAEVIEHVRAHGFPAPRVDKAGGRDLVMERVTGPTMLAALLAGDIGAPAAAAILADLHERLHMIGPVHPESDDTHVVVHLDLHPDNVVLAPTGPVLLDWTNATDGPAGLDVAMSALILAQVAVDPRSELAQPARSLLTEFAGRVGPVTMAGPAAHRRKADPTMDRIEIEKLAQAVALVEALAGPP